VPAKGTGDSDRKFKEASMVQLHPNSSSRDNGFLLGRAGGALSNLLRKTGQRQKGTKQG
jgi:hypothetical protein